MSWLSVAEKDIGMVFTSLTNSGSNTPAAQKALADIATANASVQAALPDLEDAILDDAANYLLSKIPLVGSLLQGDVDALLNSFAAKVNAKLFPTVPSAATTTLAVPAGASPLVAASASPNQIADLTVPADDPLSNA